MGLGLCMKWAEAAEFFDPTDLYLHLFSIKFIIIKKLIVNVGLKNSVAPAHFIQSPRPMLRRKKCPRMNKESPNCQKTSLRTILSSTN